MNLEGELLCVDSKSISGNLPIDDAAGRLNSCGSAARLDRVVEDLEGHAADLEDVGPSFTFLDSFEFNQSYVSRNVNPVLNTSMRGCNGSSRVMPQSSGHMKACDGKSLKYKLRELCNCTEELGAESSSCSADAELAGASEVRQDGFCSQSSEINISQETKFARMEESSSSSCALSDPVRETLRRGRSTDRHSREFPPPLPSLVSNRSLLKSFKSNGRFVLQRVEMASTSSFRAIRKDGRLRLLLVSPAPTWDVDREDSQLPEDEENREDFANTEIITATKKNSALGGVHARRLNFGTLPRFYPANSCTKRRVALKRETEPFLYDFHKERQRLVVSDEDAQFISKCKELPTAWQLPFVGSTQRAGSQSNVGDQLAYSESRAHRRGNQSIAMDAQHGFVILKLYPFNLLFLHFQRCKGGFKFNGVYCFKDIELKGEKGGNIESVSDNRFGNFNGSGRGTEDSFSLQMQGCKNQWTEGKVGFESAELNYFAQEQDGDNGAEFPVNSKAGISSFARFFESQLALFVSM